MSADSGNEVPDDERLEWLLSLDDDQFKRMQKVARGPVYTRRQIAKYLGTGAAAAVAGGASTGAVAADGHNDNDGQVGTESNPVDLIADYTEANSASVVQTNDITVAAHKKDIWSTDPGTAINEAINDLTDGTISSGGGFVQIPSGQYTYSTDIQYESGVEIRGVHGNGDLNSGSVLEYTGSGSAIKPLDDTTNTRAFRLRDLIIYENSASTPNNLFDATGCSNGCRHVNTTFFAESDIPVVEFRSGIEGYHNQFVNNRFVGGNSSHSAPLIAIRGTYNDMEFYSCFWGSAGTPTGIRNEGADAIELYGGDMENLGTGILATDDPQRHAVFGTRFENLNRLTNMSNGGFDWMPSSEAGVSTRHFNGQPSIDTASATGAGIGVRQEVSFDEGSNANANQLVEFTTVGTSNTDIYTPNNEQGNLVVVCGRDDSDGTIVFTDLVLYTGFGNITTVANTSRGTPASRSYTLNNNNLRTLQLAMSSGTYQVAANGIGGRYLG